MARIALVTGGTRGIGAAISVALKGAGVTVAASFAGNEASGIERSRTEDGHPRPSSGTWATSDACAAGVRAGRGGDLGAIDVLVNNAGITRDGFFHKMTASSSGARCSAPNLDSLFNMTRPVIDGMRARYWGRVVVISSINGQKGQMGQVNYSAAKAGDIGFVKALAQESAGKGITVNAICPGYIGTEMVQAIAPGRPQSQAHPAADPGGPARPAGGDRPRSWPTSHRTMPRS